MRRSTSSRGMALFPTLVCLGVVSGFGFGSHSQEDPANHATLEALSTRLGGRPVSLRRTLAVEIEARELQEVFELQVALPRTFEHTTRRYPILYLLDGDNTFAYAVGLYEMLRWDGLIPEMVIVAIGYGADPTDSSRNDRRFRDLTPSEMPHWDRPTGGAGAFSRFLRTEVVPFAETTFRGDPDGRILSGYSFGGLFAAGVLAEAPAAFGAYLLQSPSLWFDDEVQLETLETDPDWYQSDSRVFTSLGGKEPEGMFSPWERFVQLAELRVGRGHRFESRRYPGGHHDSLQPHALAEGLKWLFEPARVDQATLEGYAGAYALADFEVELVVREGALHLVHDGTSIPLRAATPSSFYTALAGPIWNTLGSPTFPPEKRYLLGLEFVRIDQKPSGELAIEVVANGQSVHGTRKAAGTVPG